MKREYHEGPEARRKFEQGMTALFRVPKSVAKKPQERTRKKSTKLDKHSAHAHTSSLPFTSGASQFPCP